MLLKKFFQSLERVETETKQEMLANGDNMEDLVDDDAQALSGSLEPDLNRQLEKLNLELLQLQEAQVLCKHRILLLKQAEKKSVKKSLTEHLLTHQGLRPYECKLCQARLSYSAALYNHNRIKHLNKKKATEELTED